MDCARRAIDSSAVVRLIRPAIAGSAVCAAAASALRSLRRTREGIVVGVGGRRSARQAVRTNQQLDAMAADSRVIDALSSLLTAPSVARREAGAARLLDLVLGLDLLERIRISAYIIVVAVMTHTVLLAVLGVPVHEVGWGIRAGLLVGCVILVRWPESFAAAWRDRTVQPGARQG
jgi:CBS domain containing-hemolysin-like protein